MTRTSKLLALLVALALATPAALAASSGSKSSGSSKSSHTKSTSTKSSGSSSKHTKTKACTTCERDENGKIKRSAKAKDDFMRQTGYAKGRPGYVVDHIVPLECGGADAPSNMQWQTVAEAKAKDKTERNCRK